MRWISGGQLRQSVCPLPRIAELGELRHPTPKPETPRRTATRPAQLYRKPFWFSVFENFTTLRITSLLVVGFHPLLYQSIGLERFYRKSFGLKLVGWSVWPQYPAEVGATLPEFSISSQNAWSDRNEPKDKSVEPCKSHRSASIWLKFAGNCCSCWRKFALCG